MANMLQAGHFTLSSFSIQKLDGSKKLDVSKIIHVFTINESMEYGSLRGSAILYETFDIIQGFPLKGEELIEIVYKDFFNVERTEIMFLYAITNLEYDAKASNSVNKFTIHFTSFSKFISDQKRVQKAFTTGKIHEFVKDTYEEYYVNDKQKKDLVLEVTTGDTKFVIPSYTPEQTMHFFAKRGFSTENLDQTFRFFENRDKFYFITNGELFKLAKNGIGYGDGEIDPKLGDAIGLEPKTIPIFRRNYSASHMPDRQLALMYEIVSISNNRHVNTIDDINGGGYFKELYELDLLNSTVNKNSYEHSTVAKELLHEKAFIDETMKLRPQQTFVIKDYVTEGSSGTSLRPDQRYVDLYNTKRTNFYHYNSNKVSCKIYGRNTLFAGSVIDLELYNVKANAGSEIDEMRSGRFLINEINNVFYESIYTQELIISKELK